MSITLISTLLLSCDKPNENKIYNEYFEKIDFNGQVLIAKKGNIIYQQSFGFSNMEGKIQSRDNDTYIVGSITKQFTAFCILILEDKKLLTVSDSLSKYYPNLPENWPTITIHDLLTHTSGMPTWEDIEDFDIKTPYSAEDMIKVLALKPLPFFEKGRFRYSSIGYVLLGGIIEKVSNKNYCQFVEENVFKPLNMNSTGCVDDLHLEDITTTGYAKQSDGTILKVPYNYETYARGNSNLYSNLKDLISWDESIRNKNLLSETGYRKWYSGYAQVLEQSEYEDKGDQLGYGWFLTFNNGNELFKTYHLGGVTGYKAAITRFPREEMLIVTLSNVEDQHSDKIRLDFPKLVYKNEIDKQR